MKKFISLILVTILIVASLSPMCVLATTSAGDFEVYNLQVNSVENPIGIDDAAPSFSWNMKSERTGAKQTAYQINVNEWNFLTNTIGSSVWNTGKISSDKTTDISYSGSSLKPSTKYIWNVTVWDESGKSVKSSDAYFETGLMEDEPLSDSKWISLGVEDFEIDADTSEYTINTNLKFTDAVGIIFSGEDNYSFYTLQITSAGRINFYKGNVAGKLIGNADLSGIDFNSSTFYDIKVKVNTVNKTVETYINGALKNTTTLSDADIYYRNVGFSEVDNQNAYVEELEVISKDNKYLYYNDWGFAQDNQMSAGTVENGQLYICSTDSRPSDAITAQSNLYYRFDADFTVNSGTAGFLLTGNETMSTYYYSIIDPHYSANGIDGPAIFETYKPSGSSTETRDFDRRAISGISASDLIGTKHRFTMTANYLSVNSCEVQIYLDGTRIMYHDKLDDFFTFGKVGFVAEAGSDITYDNITVWKTGAPIYRENFSSDNSLNGGTVVDGALKLTGPSSGVAIANSNGVEITEEKSEFVKYDIEADVTITGTAIGLLFSAKSAESMWMWQLNGESGSLFLRPHIWANGGVTSSDININSYFDWNTDILNKTVHVKISVSGNEIKTYIENTLVNTYTIPEQYKSNLINGKFGIRSGGPTETCRLDNFTVTKFNESGVSTIIINEDFDGGDNVFNIGRVENGELVIPAHGGVALIDSSSRGLPMFRKTFKTANKTIASARIYSSSIGVYDLYINGERVGVLNDGETTYDELKPGWTDYNDRILYYTYDITHLLDNNSDNVVAAIMGKGWALGDIRVTQYSNLTKMAFIAKTVITYTDGTQEVIKTDRTWKSSTNGAIIDADIYSGETYDANYVSGADISSQSFIENETWRKSYVSEEFSGSLSSHIGPTVQIRSELERKPISIKVYKGTKSNGTDYGEINVIAEYEYGQEFTLNPDETAIFDMGQNMVGWPYFTVNAPKNTKIITHFAEMLNDSGSTSRGNDGPKGSLYTANYRSARSTGIYISNGKGDESYRPTFTFYGFRYVSVTANKTITIKDLVAEVVGSAIKETGNIETSNSSVNQLFSNILWTQRNNFLSIPTDCPQRDERLGWTGDANMFIGTATYNADVDAFMHKWLQDIRDSQNAEGKYPHMAPVVHEWYGGAAWGDAGILVPYNLYLRYADTSIITEMYDSMTKYMDWLNTRGYLGADVAYGDWLSYEQNNEDIAAVIGTAYYALDLSAMIKMANAIGKTQDANVYAERLEGTLDYFRSQYMNENGTMKAKYPTQTCYVMALLIGAPKNETQKQNALNELKAKIGYNGNKIGCGFVGTSSIAQTLTNVGAADMAYTLLLQRDNPSWLFSVDQGATTIWERWNSYTIENGFGNADMNSFNHYAYGAVGEFMYQNMLGIQADSSNPGFKNIIFKPTPDTREANEIPDNQEIITSVKGYYDSENGKIEAAWNTTEDSFRYNIVVPANTTSKVYIPANEYTYFYVNNIDAANVTIADTGVKYEGIEDGCAVFTTTSGSFEFIAVKNEIILPESVKLSATSKTIKEGESFTLNVDILPADSTDKTVEFTSSDNSVASVTSSGKVTALKNGTATITVKTVNNISATCKVTVLDECFVHTEKTTVDKATLTADGKIVTTCSVCKKTLSTVTVYKPSSFNLSATAYTYDGKVKTPSVTVKDSKGNTLKNNTDYTVGYDSGRKVAGKYKVTVTLKGKYSGTKTLYFTINPKTTVYKASSFKLSTTAYTYNGKVKTPSVTVKDSTGKKLKKNTDYTVKYASGRKSVGKYKVTVTLKGKYSGTKTLYFTINPKATKISSLQAGSKKLTVKWSKRTAQNDGYQIQYSTSSSFKSAKTCTVKNNKTTSKTITKLKANKKYYVRVRTYKKKGGKNYYSSWSSKKSVTVKK